MSFFVPEDATRLTEHFAGYQRSFYSSPGTGNHVGDCANTAYTMSTTAVLVAAGLDVRAPSGVSTVVAFGDSITDGVVVAASATGLGDDLSVVGRNQRYPDYLQNRVSLGG